MVIFSVTAFIVHGGCVSATAFIFSATAFIVHGGCVSATAFIVHGGYSWLSWHFAW